MFLGFGACAAALVLVSWDSGFVLFSCWVFVLSLRLWRLTCCFRVCFVWGRFLLCSLLVFGFQGPDCLGHQGAEQDEGAKIMAKSITPENGVRVCVYTSDSKEFRIAK